jgi:hypothetical protein
MQYVLCIYHLRFSSGFSAMLAKIYVLYLSLKNYVSFLLSDCPLRAPPTERIFSRDQRGQAVRLTTHSHIRSGDVKNV